MKKSVKRRVCTALLLLLPFLCNMKSYAYFRDRIERDTMDYIRYADENPDLYASFGYDRDKLYEHYINSGEAEGRLAHCLYNRPDRQSIYMWGWNAENLDTERYARENPDVVAAIGTDPEALRTHFLEHGLLENRKGYGLPYEADSAKAKGMIFDVAAQITNDSMTDREKIKAVHDWIVHHTNYDKENYDRGTIPDESGHIEGVMLKGIAVCNGYAETFDCFMYVLGIEHEMVDGWADGSTPNGRHAWNRVLLDDTWLYVDCTWDDLSHQVGKDVIRYNYFLCTESEIAQDHTARDSYKVY